MGVFIFKLRAKSVENEVIREGLGLTFVWRKDRKVKDRIGVKRKRTNAYSPNFEVNQPFLLNKNTKREKNNTIVVLLKEK